MGLLQSRSRSQQRFKMSVNVFPDDIFFFPPCVQPFFLIPNLVWWCIIMSQCVMQKNWFTIFNVKVTARIYIIKIWLYLLYLLNCWSVCNQTWFDSTASNARESCEKTGLLHSRSRLQQRFSMWVNVCPGDIFWTVEHFVIKLNLVMQHHEPECAITARAYMIKIWLCGLMIHYHKPECFAKTKKKITAFKVKVTVKVCNVNECLSG